MAEPYKAAAKTKDEATSPRSSRLPRYFLAVLLVCLLLFGWYYARGTWGTSDPIDPKTQEDGVRTLLVKTDDGMTEIRTATVIPVPLATAWQILSDYEEWEKLFKTLRRKQLAEPLAKNRHHVITEITTPLGTLELDFIVTHEQTPDGGYLAWWDAPTKELPVNKGTIRITPLDKEHTLFVYTVRKQYRTYPTFLVNNMLLDQQPDVVATLRDRMIEAAKEL